MNSELLSYYPYFEANQVLTNTHLNELRQYLDEQIRLSRSQLSGVGIACGLTFRLWEPTPLDLEVLFSDSDIINNAQIILSVVEGFGISSEGYFLNVRSDVGDREGCEPKESHFIKFREYIDPSSDAYWSSGVELGEYTQLEPIYLLLTENMAINEVIEGVVEDTDSHSFLPVDPNFYKDKVLVLYLEQSDISLKTCIGNDCDNKGQKRYLEPRLLLVDKGSEGGIPGLNCGFDLTTSAVAMDGRVVQVENPEPLALPRLIEGLPGVTLSEIYEKGDLYSGYNQAISGYTAEIIGRIDSAFEVYGPFLGLSEKDAVNPLALPNWVTNLPDIQVTYAFLRDLTKAFNEYIDLAYYLHRECCREDYVFCRHMMLGLVHPADQIAQAVDPYRHYFLSTAITPDQSRNFLKAQKMYQRIIEMIRGFQVMDYSGDEGENTRIVPSREFDAAMGRSAIADYFDKSNNVDTLYKYWNPDVFIKGRESWVYSFVSDRYGAPAHIQNALRYGLDWADFFRVQNLLHKDSGALLNDIRDKIQLHNLPFHVVRVTLGNTFILEEAEAVAAFGSLNPDYQQVRVAALAAAGKFEELVSNLDIPALIAGVDLGGYDPAAQAATAVRGVRLSLVPNSLMEFSFVEAQDGGLGLGMRWGEWFHESWLKLQEVATCLVALIRFEREKLVNLPLPESDEAWFHTHLGEINDQLSLLEVIINSPAGDELTALYFQLFAMAEIFVENYPFLFHNFANQHPGLEHKNGVPKGGTLVLVEELAFESEVSGSPIPTDLPMGITITESGISFFDEGAVPYTREVVADFCLPYTCCETKAEFNPGTMGNFNLPPFAGTDTIIVPHSTILDIPVLLDDFDPSAGLLMNNPNIRITNVSIFTEQGNGGSASAFPADGPEADRYKYIKYSSPNDKPNIPTLVGIRYSVHNIQTGLDTSSVLWAMVRTNPAKPIDARADYITGTTADRILIDVLNNDLYQFKGGSISAPTLDIATLKLSGGTTGNSDILNAALEVVEIDGHPVVAYYPSNPGEDKFSYSIEYSSGETDSAEVNVYVSAACCCKDIFIEVDSFEEISRLVVGQEFNNKGMIEVYMVDQFGEKTDEIKDPRFTATLTGKGKRRITFQSSPGYFGDLTIPFVVTYWDGKMVCEANLRIKVNPVREIIEFTDQITPVVLGNFMSDTQLEANHDLRFFMDDKVLEEDKFEVEDVGTWARREVFNSVVFGSVKDFTGEASIYVVIVDSNEHPVGLVLARVFVACVCAPDVEPEVASITTTKDVFCEDETVVAASSKLTLLPTPDGTETISASNAGGNIAGIIENVGGQYYFVPGKKTRTGSIVGPVTINYTIRGLNASKTLTIDPLSTATFSVTNNSPFLELDIPVVNLPVRFVSNAETGGTEYRWNFGDGSNDLVSATKIDPSYNYKFATFQIRKESAMFLEDVIREATQTVVNAAGCRSFSTRTGNFSNVLGVRPFIAPELLKGILEEALGENQTFSSEREYQELVAFYDKMIQRYTDPGDRADLESGANEAAVASELRVVLEDLASRVKDSKDSQEATGWMFMYAGAMHSLIRVTALQKDLVSTGEFKQVFDIIEDHFTQIPFFANSKLNRPVRIMTTLYDTLNYGRTKRRLSTLVKLLDDILNGRA